jgi:tetratricopeptide (TPR) repeat protein
MSTDSTLARPATDAGEIPVRNFARAAMPWVIAGAALLLYILTLQHWISLHSLADLARISGWTWAPDLSAPLYWVVTLPVALLPARLVPLALNLLAAVCAALTLALLARTVSLLPHDRTRAQRERERGAFYLLSTPTAWIPPVLAALVCGLQLTFWERATANFRNMLDLLLFAYAIRCVLEFRIDERESWLTRASLVFGLGMANNAAMVGFFPAFLVVLIWIKGISFFDSRFLLRMFGWGMIGISLYLVLPIFYATQDVSGYTFWSNLKRELVDQKNFLVNVPFSKRAVLNGENPLIVYGLYSLLPVFLMGIRWPSTFGDTSATGAKATRTIFHVVHVMFLLACVWIMLDPPVSPRNRSNAQFGLPFLTLYYLAALAVGYFSGYVLLVFGKKPSNRFASSHSGLLPIINTAAVGAVFVLLVAAPLILLYRNLPQIKATNGPTVSRYASMLVENIPSSGAVLLSDTPPRLLLARAYLARENKAGKHVFVDTGSLPFSTYHRFLKQRYGERWPVDLPAQKREGRVPDLNILQLVTKLVNERETFYLHPSVGYYFELLHLESRGMVYRLKTYPENALLVPPPGEELIRQNESFWRKTKQDALESLAGLLAKSAGGEPAGIAQKLLSRLHLKPHGNSQAEFIGTLYSQPLVYWGVELQKTARLQKAGEAGDLAVLSNAAAHFATALELNPNNLVAKLNQAATKQLQAGGSGAIPSSKEMEEGLGKYRNLVEVVMENGPFDEANRCYQLGVTFALGKNYRQSKQHLLRANALDPENMEPRLAIAEVDLAVENYSEALATVKEIRANAKPAFRKRHETDLLFIEASVHLALTNDAAANQVIGAALRAFPEDEGMADVAIRIYMNNGRYTNALEVADAYLKHEPDNIQFLTMKGFLCIQTGAFAEAVSPSSRVIDLAKRENALTETNVLFSARLNRAIAYFRTDKLDEARADYMELQKITTNDFRTYYGLAEIAFRKNDKQEAIRNYQLYLSNAPPDMDEAKAVAERLKELQSR